jgi:hypothetical protein
MAQSRGIGGLAWRNGWLTQEGLLACSQEGWMAYSQEGWVAKNSATEEKKADILMMVLHTID